MGKKHVQPSLLNRILSEIPIRYDQRYTLAHKKPWLCLVKDRIWPCDPEILHRQIQKALLLDEYQPRGDRLLYLRSRDKFTVLPSGRPRRPEEALERLLVQTNPDTMYGQMPIGGGKESVDIVKLESNTGTFIELKPWHSSNSPLYALLESLKNLGLYRILQARNHRGCEIIQNVQLAILAPVTYYQAYHLLDEDMQLSNSDNVQAFLDSVAKIFQVDIRLNVIDWPENELWDVCSQICPGEIFKNKIISVAEYPAVEALKQKNWIELITVRRSNGYGTSLA